MAAPGEGRDCELLARCALNGDDRRLAGAVAPGLLRCRSGDDAERYFGRPDAAAPEERLAAGVVLAWAMDARGCYEAFRLAHLCARECGRLDLAAGALERLAHHARLFGDAAAADEALEDAMSFAQEHQLREWSLRCAAAAARLALDRAESDRAQRLLERARAFARDPDDAALLCAIGVTLAAALGDAGAATGAVGAELLEAALHSRRLECSVAATTALLGARADPGADIAIALRRALLQSTGSAQAMEVFSLAARHGDMEEARLAADAPAALIAPNRPYVNAHALLARAHLLLRCGERAAAVDHAGDAARAFQAIGMRRWTGEAMLLLVRQESREVGRRRRNRPRDSALTEREQQVAHLIRRGARNREVAAALQISEHTVERHVSSILGRLGLRSRWQIAAPPSPPQD